MLRTPARYLRSVVSYQVVGWGCRIGAARPASWSAFGVPATLEAALIVQVAGSLGGLFPATPGRPRAEAGAARRDARGHGRAHGRARLQRRHGADASIVANATLGLACLALMLRNLRFMRAISQARSDRGGPAPES